MGAVPEDARRAYERATTAGEPLQALQALAALRDCLPGWEADVARAAIGDGATWESIGAALGISRQAAWERMRTRVAEAIEADRDRLRDRRHELEKQRRKRGQ
jgi:hypothetical protein